jgi:hypothetical protein
MALSVAPKEAEAAEGPNPRDAGVRAGRQRRARRMAYVGCCGALGYGVMKVIWALGGTIGVDPKSFRLAPAGLTTAGRYFDYWGTQILAGLAVVILLGLVYPWGNGRIVRPVLRTLAWAGSLLAVVGVVGLILTIRDYHLGADRLGGVDPGTFLFTYLCFLVLGVSFGVTAWLTRR